MTPLCRPETYQHLIKAIDLGTLPHALLIESPEGRGGLTLAVQLAQYLQCPHRADGKPCGTCPSCYKYSKLVHPDLHFIFPVVNKNSQADGCISGDFMAEWREALLSHPCLTHAQWMQAIDAGTKQSSINVRESGHIVETLNVKPYESDYRVVIIWLPEKLHESAANKLLKVIEEPYPKTHFLLVSEEPQHIIGTIISRTVRFVIPPLSEEEIAHALMEHNNAPQAAAIELARLAHGSYSAAEALLNDEEERSFFFDMFCRMMRDSYARRLFAMKEWSEEISHASIGREKQKRFLQYAQSLIRENYVCLLYTSPSPRDRSVSRMPASG